MNKIYRNVTHSSVPKGFTLLEVLVVVLIIGILAAAALPQYQKAVAKAKYSNLMAATNALSEAQRLFYLANGTYAASLDQLDVDLPGAQSSINGTTYRVSDGELYQINVDGGDRVMGLLREPPVNNYYMVYYETGQRLCRAYEDGIPHYVCRSFGGVEVTPGFYVLP